MKLKQPQFEEPMDIYDYLEYLRLEIILALGPSKMLMEQYIQQLELESRKVVPADVFEAGKRCRAQGVPLEKGLYDYVAALHTDETVCRQAGELQRLHTELIKALREGKQLLEKYLYAYRLAYNHVNHCLDAFFTLGYQQGEN